MQVAISLSQLSEEGMALCEEFELEETSVPSASAQVSLQLLAIDCLPCLVSSLI